MHNINYTNPINTLRFSPLPKKKKAKLCMKKIAADYAIQGVIYDTLKVSTNLILSEMKMIKKEQQIDKTYFIL